MFHQTSFLELDLPPRFGDWFAGFVDGEGCFAINCSCSKRDGNKEVKTGLQITLRDDDLEVLEYICDTLNIGNIYKRQGYGNGKPTAQYYVYRKPDLKHVIIPLFEKHPLMAKKKRDFEIWKRAVEIAFHLPKGSIPISNHLWQQLKQLEAELKAVRVYASPNGVVR